MHDTNPHIALITGATGFVGSHLTKQLVSQGWQVYILTRKESRLPRMLEGIQLVNLVHDGSTQSIIDCVSRAKPSVVFHLASLFISEHAAEDITSLIQSNILFGTQLLEAMRASGVQKIINTGTSWQHFNNEEYNPVCLYAATKQAFEAILEYYIQVCDMKAVTLKLFDTYGPEDQRQKLFSLLNKAAKTGEPLDMSMGEQLIDLVHIDDVVKAYIIAAQYLIDDEIVHHEKYVISSGCSLSLRKLVELYIQTTGKNIPVNWGARPYRAREVMNLWTNGLQLPGWRPSIALAEGLKKVYK
jgi:nucleoside-diphosphate-sugar epimerase